MSEGWAAWFDEAAATYDADTAAHGWSPNRHLDEVLAGLGGTPADVLDLGAGTGQTGAVLAARHPAAALTLVEAAPAMAALAAQRCPGARVVVADVDAHLAADEASYDLVVAVGLLELLPDAAATLAAAAVRVRAGGHLVVTWEPLLGAHAVQAAPTSSPDAARGLVVRRSTAADLDAAVAGAGLTRVATRRFAAFERSDDTGGATYDLHAWRRG